MQGSNFSIRNSKCRLGFFAGLALVCIAPALSAAPQLAGARVQDKKEERIIVNDFMHRVGAYVKLRASLEANLPKLKVTNQPGEIAEHQKVLSEKLLDTRKDAKVGDIFTPEISEMFRNRIKLGFHSEQGRETRRTIRQGEPVELPVHVNQIYPRSMPLTTVPPTLLMRFPKLPREIKYEIIGRNFALMDVKTRMVIDFIPEALPPLF